MNFTDNWNLIESTYSLILFHKNTLFFKSYNQSQLNTGKAKLWFFLNIIFPLLIRFSKCCVCLRSFRNNFSHSFPFILTKPFSLFSLYYYHISVLLKCCPISINFLKNVPFINENSVTMDSTDDKKYFYLFLSLFLKKKITHRNI